MKRVFYCLVLFALLITSCNRNSDIMTDVHEMDYRNQTQDVISSRTAIHDILGANNLIVFDTLVMITASDPDGQLQVYSSNTLDCLGKFCKRGRANNEFNRATASTEQAFYRDGHVILVVVDVPNILKEVDVTASIQKGSTVVVSTQECFPLTDGEFMILGNDYSNRYEYARNVYNNVDEQITKVPSRYTLYKDGKKKELKFFRSLMESEVENKTLPYIGSLYKHPQRNMVVQSFQRLDYLLFMDFDNNDYYAIHQEGSLSFNDTFKKRDQRSALHFTDGASSSDCIMLLYWQGDYTLKDTDGNLPELMVFDWDGNYVSGFKMDRRARAIEYDEKHKVLYGLCEGEDLYAYDMEGLLP